MKNLLLIIFVLTIGLVSCDEYLDKLPDNRTELTTPESITKILVSAYPDASNAKMSELSSDNTAENGGSYSYFNLCERDFYFWDDTFEEGQDTPHALWTACYQAIASANQALHAIEKMGSPSTLNVQRGEALVCRAYAHFLMAITFCNAYDQKQAENVLGIPYMKELGTTVDAHYERGTLAETYKQIESDLTTGLPLIQDDHYSVAKYHFNRKAAYAFAARFYLYYVQSDKSNYEKVIEYATKVLGSNPSEFLRDWKELGSLSPNGEVQPNAYVKAENHANLLISKTTSWWAFVGDPGYSTCMLYSHNAMLAAEDCESTGPWGAYTTFYQQPFTGNGSTKYGFRRMITYQQIMNSNGSFLGHMLTPVFTTDETLLCRAEAYTMLKRYDEALEDMQAWQKAYTFSKKELTVESINSFYQNLDYWSVDKMTVKKKLHPSFTVEAGVQENMIHCILHMRRILTLGTGLRWQDVKRYGITIHRLYCYGKTVTVTDEMEADDMRRAIQIPESVIAAGMEENPRK